MDKEKILDYVMNSPGNSNRAVLSGMLDESGGGNSDFSTAQVTLIGIEGTPFGLYERQIEEFPYGYKGVFCCNGQLITNPALDSSMNKENNSATYTLYYIGNEYITFPDNTYISSTGAVTYNEETGKLTITGDCTITGFVSD